MSLPYAGPAQPWPYQTQPTAPAKKRPSAWWFGVGGILLVVAATSAGIAAAMVVRFFVDTDASFPMQGVHRVTLPAHTTRMVFGSGNLDTSLCLAVDRRFGAVTFRTLGDSETSAANATDFSTFDTGSGHLVFRCRGSASETVWVSSVPSTDRVVLLVVLGGVVPVLVGGLGVIVLLITTILWFSRRPPPAPYAGPPGYGRPPAGQGPPPTFS